MKADKFIKVIRYLLVTFFIIWGVAWLSIRGFKRNDVNRNFVEKTFILMHDTPDMIKEWFKSSEHQMKIISRDEMTEQIGKLTKFDKVNDSLYLLYYNYMGDEKGKIFFQSIKSGEILYSWNLPMDEIMQDLIEIDKKFNEKYYSQEINLRFSDRVSKNIPAIQISAPIMFKDSSIVFHCGILGYLYKLDKNSSILWKSKSLTHHSIEVDEEGTLWTCSVNLHNDFANRYGFRDDVILGIDQNGNETHFISLTDMFMKNRLFKDLIGSTPGVKNTYGLDPYHLNDILPIENDGIFWKKNDLFISLRHQSMLAIFRPNTGEIIWHKKGPWYAQHDINIVSDSVISVFNNNTLFTIAYIIADSTSNIAYYNLSSDTTDYYYSNVFNSGTQGRQSLIPNGELIVEETNTGKYIIFDKDKNVEAKFYIPFFSDSTNAMNPTWGRVYLKTKDDFIHF